MCNLMLCCVLQCYVIYIVAVMFCKAKHCGSWGDAQNNMNAAIVDGADPKALDADGSKGFFIHKFDHYSFDGYYSPIQ